MLVPVWKEGFVYWVYRPWMLRRVNVKRPSEHSPYSQAARLNRIKPSHSTVVEESLCDFGLKQSRAVSCWHLVVGRKCCKPIGIAFSFSYLVQGSSGFMLVAGQDGENGRSHTGLEWAHMTCLSFCSRDLIFNCFTIQYVVNVLKTKVEANWWIR